MIPLFVAAAAGLAAWLFFGKNDKTPRLPPLPTLPPQRTLREETVSSSSPLPPEIQELLEQQSQQDAPSPSWSPTAAIRERFDELKRTSVSGNERGTYGKSKRGRSKLDRSKRR